MANMMKIITPEHDFFSLPREVLNRLRGASDTELKVLLYMFANREAETADLCRELGIRPADADAAVAFWRGAGIFREDDSAEKKPVASPSSLFKSYDSETIQKQLEDPAFRECCDLVAEKLEKAQLTKNDLSSLVYLHDYVGLPPAMISGVAEYSVSRGKKSMQYLMTTALKMYQEDGIDTYEKFESHMARLEKLHSDVGRFRTMCGFGDRELSSKESSLLNRWFFEYGLPFDVVRMGYDRMIDSIGKVRMSYLDTILKRWFDAGLTTAEAVEAEDKKPENPAPGYGTSSAFFEAALNAGFEEPAGDKKTAKAEHGEEDAP